MPHDLFGATRTGRLVADALAAGAPARIGEAAEAFLDIARRAVAAGPDDDVYAEYQRILYALNETRDPHGDAARRWLASLTYPLEERAIERAPHHEAKSAPDFLAQVQPQLSMKGRLGSEMSRHLFDGNPTVDDVRVYILHHWYRSRGFYRLLQEIAPKVDLDVVGCIYHNLDEETGGVPGTTAHPILLQRLLKHLDLPASFDDHPASARAHAYLNNRTRCVRTTTHAWGLALLYALEFTTPETHISIYGMLKKLGLPDEACEFHRLHATCDEQHAADFEPIIARYVDTAEAQSLFLSSLAHHQRLSRAYFEEIWQEMRAPGAAAKATP